MATRDSVIEHQQQLFGVISRAIENLKKLGAPNINRGNLRSRMEALKSNWDKFQTNHELLLRFCNAEQRNVPYFQEDIYLTCEEEFINA